MIDIEALVAQNDGCYEDEAERAWYKHVLEKRLVESQRLVENANGHIWQLDEHGFVDDARWMNDFHNGPVCTVCGYHYCVLCFDVPLKECPGKGAD